MQAGMDKIIWFCIDTEIRDQGQQLRQPETREMNRESPCTKAVCHGLSAPPHQGFTLGQVSSALCPRNALVSQCWDCHGRPWPGSGNSPFPSHLIPQEPAFCQNLPPVWKKSAIRSSVTEHHRLPALALFPRKMAPEKRFHIFTQFGRKSKAQDCNKLSFFPYIYFFCFSKWNLGLGHWIKSLAPTGSFFM